MAVAAFRIMANFEIMKKTIALLCCLAGWTLTSLAVPAKPGLIKITQPDGTVVETRIIGDEHFHYYETPVGEILLRDEAGVLRPATIGQNGELKASGELKGVGTPVADREAIMRVISEKMTARADSKPSRIAPKPIPSSFPTTGTVKGLILLVEYQDVKLTPAATKEHYEQLCNEAGYSSEATSGSVLDYFVSQSNGRFTPEFDIFGPITLPHERAYYGTADNGLVNQFRDAALIADQMGLDFSVYDINNDYFIDFLFVIFAGHGEAQGGPYESVWPAMMDLSTHVFDYFDGLNLGVAACSCELKGGEGTDLDGVATICHEFSHILGLADIYDTSNQGSHGMCHYDIMDIGTYNDNLVTPSGYTAMDKYTLGWLDPIVLDSSRQDVCLRPFNETHDAAFIVNPDNADEYFTLENRQKQGWDKGIPGHGLVISYCHYDKSVWAQNVVNAARSRYEHVRIMAADNVWSSNVLDEEGDPYPGTSGNTMLTGTSVPAASWMSSGNPVPVNWAVTNIRETEDGNILFDFQETAGVGKVNSDKSDITVNGNTINVPYGAVIYDITGRQTVSNTLSAGIYIVKTSAGSVKIRI